MYTRNAKRVVGVGPYIDRPHGTFVVFTSAERTRYFGHRSEQVDRHAVVRYYLNAAIGSGGTPRRSPCPIDLGAFDLSDGSDSHGGAVYLTSVPCFYAKRVRAPIRDAFAFARPYLFYNNNNNSGEKKNNNINRYQNRYCRLLR